jgi:hypothetical protein
MSEGLDIGPNGIVANQDWHFIRQVPDQHAISRPYRPGGATGAGPPAGTSPARRSGTLAGEPKTGPGRLAPARYTTWPARVVPDQQPGGSQR